VKVLEVVDGFKEKIFKLRKEKNYREVKKLLELLKAKVKQTLQN